MATRDELRRETPAQERVYQRDRERENDRVASGIRSATQMGATNFGNSGSPTIREAGESVRRGVGSSPPPAGPGAPSRFPQREGPTVFSRLREHMTRVPSAQEASRSQRGSQPTRGGGGAAGDGGRPAAAVMADVNRGAIGSAQRAGAQAMEANQGYYTRPDGSRVTVPGTRRVQDEPGGAPGISVMGDMGAANQRFAAANRIRQQTIDRQRPQNQVTVIGGEQGAGRGGVDAQIERLVRQAGRTSDPWQRAAVNRQISQLTDMAGLQTERDTARATNQTALQRQELANQGALERAALSAMGSDEGESAYNAARANYYNAQAEDLARGGELTEPEMPDVEAFLAAGREDLAEQATLEYQAQKDQYDILSFAQREGLTLDEMIEDFRNGEIGGYLGQKMARVYGQPEAEEDRQYAEGGMVAPPTLEETMGPSAMGMQMEGEPVGFGQAAPPPMSREYERYMDGARQIGVQPVPYEDFVNLMPQAQPMPEPAPGGTEPYGRMGFAAGGPVPGQEEMLATQIGDAMAGEDVSGRMVMDPDPMAQTDSIPAVIDGQTPAALDSGEFVIPEHAVRFHGIDKLMKLIAQAEKGSTNGKGGAAEEVSAVRA